MAAPFAGTKTLQPFSPRWADPDLLEQTSIGRKALIDKLEQLAIEGAGGPNKYQRLLIGPRGSGKTHVLKVLHTRLRRNVALQERLLIVYLLEDELGVASMVDFLVRLLRAVVTADPENQGLAAGLDALYDLPASAQQRKAAELLMEAAGDRDILILMENLGVTFDSKQGFGRKGQQALRDLVQQNPRFMIFATAQALLDGISDPHAPFYEFFRIEYLKKLTFDEALELLSAMASAYGNSQVVDYLASAEGYGRVRAIYAFTGGNHRLLVNFYDVLAADSVTQLSDLFIEALEPLKPYYQEQMRSLSAQQQKIVQFLSVSRTPKTVKEIARGCLVTSNTVSSQMQSLLDRRLVERIPQGRESYYEISETLFRICYEADLDQGAPVRLFVDFLGNLYTAKELERRARGFRLLAGGSSADAWAEAELYEAALQRYHGLQAGTHVAANWKQFFEEALREKAFQDVISFAARLGDAKDSEIVVAEATARAELGDVPRACEILHKELVAHPGDPVLLLRLGDLLSKRGDHEGAAGCYETLVSQDSISEVVVKLAMSYSALDRGSDAVRVLRERTEKAPSDINAGVYLFGFLFDTGQRQAAFEIAHGFSQNSSNDPRLQLMRAVTTALGGRPHEGRSMLESIPKSGDKGFAPIWAVIGNDLLRRSEEAAGFLEKAVSIDPGQADYWLSLSVAYAEAHEWDKADNALRQVIRLQSTNTIAWEGLALMLELQGRRREAIQLLENATSADDQGTILRLRGSLQLRDGELMKAANDLRSSIVLDPSNAGGHLWYASALLFMQGRTQEALDEVRILASLAVDDDMDSLSRLFRALFTQTLEHSESFLNQVLDAFQEHNREPMAILALTLAVLSLVKAQSPVMVGRISDLIPVLEAIATRHPAVAVPVKLLKVGIAYNRDKDEKALLELTKEERELLIQELGLGTVTAGA